MTECFPVRNICCTVGKQRAGYGEDNIWDFATFEVISRWCWSESWRHSQKLKAARGSMQVEGLE